VQVRFALLQHYAIYAYSMSTSPIACLHRDQMPHFTASKDLFTSVQIVYHRPRHPK